MTLLYFQIIRTFAAVKRIHLLLDSKDLSNEVDSFMRQMMSTSKRFVKFSVLGFSSL